MVTERQKRRAEGTIRCVMRRVWTRWMNHDAPLEMRQALEKVRQRAKYAKKYARNAERERARTQAYKARHPLKVLKWESDRRQRILRASDGTLTLTVLRSLYDTATRCIYCERMLTARTKELDHPIPVSRGGVHGISNVAICCTTCNASKGRRTPDEWARDPRSPLHRASAA